MQNVIVSFTLAAVFVLLGSVATKLRRGGRHNFKFTRHEFLVVTVKEWLKSMYFTKVIEKISRVPLILDHPVYIVKLEWLWWWMCCRTIARLLECRRRMMLIECGWRAAQWQNKFSYLLSGILPKILDVAPHRNTHDIIYIDDALKANKGHLMLTYIHSAVFRLAHPSICLSVCLSVTCPQWTRKWKTMQRSNLEQMVGYMRQA